MPRNVIVILYAVFLTVTMRARSEATDPVQQKTEPCLHLFSLNLKVWARIFRPYLCSLHKLLRAQ
jgi:hypothetical protein